MLSTTSVDYWDIGSFQTGICVVGLGEAVEKALGADQQKGGQETWGRVIETGKIQKPEVGTRRQGWS